MNQSTPNGQPLICEDATGRRLELFQLVMYQNAYEIRVGYVDKIYRTDSKYYSVDKVRAQLISLEPDEDDTFSPVSLEHFDQFLILNNLNFLSKALREPLLQKLPPFVKMESTP